MNKKLLTLAVAAAMVAPAAAMAEAILYGKLHMSIDYQDVEATTINPVTGRTEGFRGWGLNGGGDLKGASRSNRIGVKGSEDLGNGLKAIYQVEFGIKMTEEGFGSAASGGNDTVSMRNSFVGLAGGWGTFLVGRHDTPMKISTGKLDFFSDTMADYNGTVGFDDKRVDNGIAYISPSLSGFQLAALVHAGGGSTFGSGENVNADSLAEGYSVAGIYSNGPFYGSLAYESFGNELYMGSDLSLTGNCAPDALSCSYIDDDYTKWRVGLGLLDWNGFSVAAIYEEQSDSPGSQVYTTIDGVRFYGDYDKIKLWQIQAGYSFGNNMVKAMYGSGDRDGDFPSFEESNTLDELKDSLEGDYYTWAIAFDHNFSKRTRAYVLYTQVDDDYDPNDWDGFSLGVIHKF